MFAAAGGVVMSECHVSWRDLESRGLRMYLMLFTNHRKNKTITRNIKLWLATEDSRQTWHKN